VKAIVQAQLCVKRDRCHAALASGYAMSVDFREDLHVGPVLGDPRGADEHAVQRPSLEPLNA
jgi:hypothetical protein